jgi:hypothetical protein
MQADRSRVSGLSTRGRARPPRHLSIDGRTVAAKRIRALVRAYVARLGGLGAVDAVMMASVQAAATRRVLADQLATRSLAGEAIDPAVLATADNAARRAEAALGLSKAKPVHVPLRERLAAGGVVGE